MKQKLHDLVLKKIGQMIQSSRLEIDAESVPVIREFFALYMKDNQLIQHIYYAYKQGLSSLDLHHQQEIISYKREESTYSIKFSNKQFELDEELFVKLLVVVIDITREVLPLGTVVELNPAHFNPDQQSKKPTKVVITERFVAPTGYNSYFPYGGIVYPIGEMKKGAKVHFTEPLIQRIVHKGFQDEVEDAFVFLMKDEFIVDKDIYSIEFSHDDMKKIENGVKQKVGEV